MEGAMMGLKSVLKGGAGGERGGERGEKIVVGLMSGTSMDGVDAALVRIRGSGLHSTVELIDFTSNTYDPSIRKGLESLLAGGSTAEVSELNFLLGAAFAEAAIGVIEKAGLPLTELSLIGSHGQTVYHNPPSSGEGAPSTLQLGDIDVIAKTTGVTTVGDFRPADMALGGEGAPIVPYVDYLLFHSEDGVRIAQNIGGIANITVVGGHLSDVIAFDTGPGNMLMDCAVRLATGGKESFDRDGAYASSGEVDSRLLDALLAGPYFAKPPPKSTGAELFGIGMAEGLYNRVKEGGLGFEDLMRTLLELTVESIAISYERFVAPLCETREFIVSGGGASNPVLFERLVERLSPIRVVKSDEYGVPADAKEAIAMAVLANELIAGGSANLVSVTGAKRAVPLGKIALGGGT